MTQEQKELLLNDLCARLPYGVKLLVPSWDEQEMEYIDKVDTLYSINGDKYIKTANEDYDFSLEDVKPHLFPLSSMTEEQTEEVHNLIYQGISESVDETKEWLKTRKENDLRPITLTYILNYKLVIDWFRKNHFDYYGLIPMGLAIDATGKNIY